MNADFHCRDWNKKKKKAKSTTYKVCWTHYVLSYIYCNKENNTIELICSKEGRFYALAPPAGSS